LDLSFSFASEQAIDQLAYLLKMDPWVFRQRNIKDERWLGVLNAVAQAANWKPRPAASNLSNAKIVAGRGIGVGTHLASYGAAVEVMAGAAAAIANAFFDATGVRMQEYPLTPARVLAALKRA